MEKQYIIRKYIMAHSIADAIKKERLIKPDECWINEDWKYENINKLGFNTDENNRKSSVHMGRK